jgi:hypothetical protein
MRAIGTTVLTIFGLVLGIAGARGDQGGGARSSGDHRSNSAIVADCSASAVREVRLDGAVSVDGFRVEVGGSRSSTKVRVRAGKFERVLNVSQGARAVRFSPALQADTFTVTIEPASGERAICPAKITLFGGADEVAVLMP